MRDAFRRRGHCAYSCDLLDGEGTPEELQGEDSLGLPAHLKNDALEVAYWMQNGRPFWDLLIAHPPCTDLAVSGARWFKRKGLDRIEAAAYFFKQMLWAPVPKVCVENPKSVASRLVQPPTQVIHPWQFGHGEVKETWLWLVNLPPLKHTNIVEGREATVHKMPPGPDRWKERSRTFQGIADAMADQWGSMNV